MCDLNRVFGFLVAAKAPYIASLVLLGIGIANSASFFAAAGNVPLMIAVIASAAVSTGMYAAALASLDECAGRECAAEFDALRVQLVRLLALMGVYTAGLLGVTVLAAIPWVGAAAIGTLITLSLSLTILVTGGIEAIFPDAIQRYNGCRVGSGAGNSVLLSFVIVFAGLAVVASAVVGGGGLFALR